MNLLIKISAIILVIVILISSIFIIVSVINEDEKDIDSEAPIIDEITGDTTGTLGRTTTISLKFSDNINVTQADIFYRSASDDAWNTASIFSGIYDISISNNKFEDWHYYVTINDAAGNGPIGSPSADGSSYYTINVKRDIESLSHSVFIEEGTANWCPNCPAVGDILYDLYKTGEYNFYYVSLVEDQNSIAKSRLDDDYNIYGYPTIFIDGGFELLSGGNTAKSTIAEEIKRAEQRDAAKIDVNVSSEIIDNEIKTSVRVTNYETSEYTGRLRVYLTEVVSRWQDYDGKSYHYGFIDYIIDEDIKIGPEEEKVLSKNYDVSELDVENLMIIAVVFNSESTEKYADKENNENKFDAYFADAADGTLVVEGGNLPPQITGINLERGKLHLLGTPLFKTILKNTILIGKTTISIEASDDSKVERVEFYLDDTLVANISNTPYEWIYESNNEFKFKHTIKVIAYDDDNKASAPATIDVIPVFFSN